MEFSSSARKSFIFLSSLNTHLLYSVHIIHVHCTVLVYVFVMKNKNEKTSVTTNFSFIAVLVDNSD
jgi:hypothetical protein